MYFLNDYQFVTNKEILHYGGGKDKEVFSDNPKRDDAYIQSVSYGYKMFVIQREKAGYIKMLYLALIPEDRDLSNFIGDIEKDFNERIKASERALKNMLDAEWL